MLFGISYNIYRIMRSFRRKFGWSERKGAESHNQCSTNPEGASEGNGMTQGDGKNSILFQLIPI